MRIWLNKYFGFSKGEFNGLLLLIFIILLLKSAPLVYQYYKPIDKDTPDLMAKIKKLEVTDETSFQYARENIENRTNVTTSKLFNFDPNKIDLIAWQALGLSPKQAKSIINYRNKGGKFYKAEDLQKMYTLSPEIYKKLLPYIHIEHDISLKYKKDFHFEKKEYVKKALVIVDINQADSTQLDEIKGIGPAFANRILKYRERLGGFYKKEQLMEVYGIDSTKYTEIKDQISVGMVKLRNININTATFNELKVMPYLSSKQINAIIQYRRQHGNYTMPNDLKKVVLLTPQTIEKIIPYIVF